MVKSKVSQSLSERAHQFILSRILSRDLPLGSPVTRRPVARSLGINLIPVAAALNRLGSDGLVESLPLRVVRDTRCKPLIDALERSHVLIFNWLYSTASQFESIPPRWHLDLAEAPARDGVEGADRAMRAHVRYGKEVVLMRLAGMAEEIRRATRTYRGPQQSNKPAGTRYEEAHHL
jgi:DNA-binding GntR family transcriptional regulator